MRIIRRTALLCVVATIGCELPGQQPELLPSPARDDDLLEQRPFGGDPPVENSTEALVDLVNDISLLANGVGALPEDLRQLQDKGFAADALSQYVDDLLHRPLFESAAYRVIPVRARLFRLMFT